MAALRAAKAWHRSGLHEGCQIGYTMSLATMSHATDGGAWCRGVRQGADRLHRDQRGGVGAFGGGTSGSTTMGEGVSIGRSGVDQLRRGRNFFFSRCDQIWLPPTKSSRRWPNLAIPLPNLVRGRPGLTRNGRTWLVAARSGSAIHKAMRGQVVLVIRWWGSRRQWGRRGVGRGGVLSGRGGERGRRGSRGRRGRGGAERGGDRYGMAGSRGSGEGGRPRWGR